jgi:AcrR family transcriptional regulator
MSNAVAITAPGLPADDVPAARAPGRPRSAEAERAIIDAVLQLVAENGFDGLSVEGVASRAGVGKGTIYRRWPGKEAMLVDALASVSEDLPDVPDHEPVRDSLVALVDTIRSSTQDTPAGRLLPRVMASVQQYPDVIDQYRARVVERRSQRMRDLLARGMERGELRSDLDVDVAVTLLVGPILYIVMMRSTSQAIDRGTSERLVDGVLQGLRGT